MTLITRVYRNAEVMTHINLYSTVVNLEWLLSIKIGSLFLDCLPGQYQNGKNKREKAVPSLLRFHFFTVLLLELSPF